MPLASQAVAILPEDEEAQAHEGELRPLVARDDDRRADGQQWWAVAGGQASSSGSHCHRCCCSQQLQQKRVQIACLGCCAWIVAYSDRTNISLAIIAMEADLGFGPEVSGMVFGAFFAGYACTQVLGGWSAVRFGGKRVLAVAVAMWSLWTVLTPPAAAFSVSALLVCRVALGLGEGLALPALHHVTAQWVPAHERSRFVALVTSGQYIGKALALVCSPLVAVYWPAIFYLFAALGGCWLLVWMQLAADSPARHPTITDVELCYITGAGDSVIATKSTAAQSTDVPWGRICRSRAVAGAVLCHFGHNWANYFALSWLPTYLHEVVGTSLEQSGFVLVLPFVAPVAGGNAGAWLADRLLSRGWRVIVVRRLMECISCGVSMLCLGYFAVVSSPSVSLPMYGIATVPPLFFSRSALDLSSKAMNDTSRQIRTY